MHKKKKQITKEIGYIDEEICEKFNLSKTIDRRIIQSFDLYLHIQKHMPDFKDIDIYNNIATNLDKLLINPIFVFYDRKKNSLLYYSHMSIYVCLVVKLCDSKSSYIATIYPVNENKIRKMKEKSYILN